MNEQEKREKVIRSLETAVKNFERYSGDEYGREYDYARVEVETLEDALALLKAQEPRVHGRWIDENPDDSLDPRMRCSICTGIESPLLKWRYCPDCGAKMDGERRDDDGKDA